MQSENEPLYKLSIREFKALARSLIDEVLKEHEQTNKPLDGSNADKEEHFTIKGLAEYLKCTKASIHNYKKKGLPYYRIGRKVLFRKQEVLKFMKSIKSKRIIEV